jgi:isocitrate dehydrogenase kinase/phosphatase
MTSDQYTELVGFLGRKFDAIDREFVEVRRHATVLFEQARAERRTMMERIELRFERVDQRMGSLEQTVSTLDGSVRAALADHESRLRSLE